MNTKPIVNFGVRRLVGALSRFSRRMERQSCDESQHSKLNRRDFVRAGIRTLMFGALTWLAVTLLRRSCTNQGVCGSCPAYAGCDLPWRKEQGS